MTTGLVEGMSLERAAALVAAKAVEMLGRSESADLGVWTETGKRSVLVGFARRGKAAGVLAIPIEEYDGVKLLELMERN